MTNIHPTHHSPKGRFFGYLRVSTPKQGFGVSLLTQREAIEQFAAKRGFAIIRWFEEKETAARRGRPLFGEMLKCVRNGEADGIIVHKVDRSARNLKDWADLGELIDQGISVYFAGDDLDLTSRSGRLAADIQAVVAADYIRNLREEAKSGIQKRLEQGLLPNHAPLGYLNAGSGKVKPLDPLKASLVKLAFSWYATGEYTLRTLSEELFRSGLRNHAEGRVTASGLSQLFRNPFYIGYVHTKKSVKLYPGLHVPLIDQKLFFEVQSRLRARVWPKRLNHRFRFSKMFRCATCSKALSATLQKGHIYYRCHTVSCPTTSVREEALAAALQEKGCNPHGVDTVGFVSGKEIRVL
jgi:DNA invertase Pin-like site-specific DNA recombinase